MDYHFKNVLETPDLQKIIENNTWLFGSQYTIIGAEEDDFVKTSQKLRNSIPEIDNITQEEIEENVSIEGVRRQVDLFLARKIPTTDSKGNSYYKCTIIEIKRPSISLNYKHLQQIDRYAEIIERHPSFSSEKLRFELILVGRKISDQDIQIRRRLDDNNDKGEQGLISSGRIKCYVKNWYTIFDEFTLSNNYLLSELKLKRNSLSKIGTQELVKELQVHTK